MDLNQIGMVNRLFCSNSWPVKLVTIELVTGQGDKELSDNSSGDLREPPFLRRNPRLATRGVGGSVLRLVKLPRL
jgi:hypothetical protein